MAKAKRVKTRYAGIYRVGARYEWRTRSASGMVDTLDEARTAKAKAEANGPVPQAVRGSFGEYALDWLAAYQGRTARGFGESTRQRYRESLTLYAIPYFDEVRRLKVAQIRRQHVKAFIAWLATAPERSDEPGAGRRPLARATVERTLAPVKAMFADAEEDDLLPTNPAKVRINLAVESVDPDDESDGKARPFVDAQLAAVLGAVPERWALMFDVLSATGVRWGELVELRGRDVATVDGRPHLRIQRAWSDKTKRKDGTRGVVKLPKTGFGRRDVPLSPDLARRLWRLQRAPNALLFVNGAGGRLDYSGTRRRVLVPLLKAASAGDADDVTWAGFHTFRHTVASRLFAQGRNVKQVQRWLGHHKASFTLDTYVHLLGDHIGGPLAPVERNRTVPGGQQGANKYAETAGIEDASPAPKTSDLQA